MGISDSCTTVGMKNNLLSLQKAAQPLNMEQLYSTYPELSPDERSWLEIIRNALGGFDGKRILEIGTDLQARKLQGIASIYQPKELIGINPAFPTRKFGSAVRVEQIYAEHSGFADASIDGVFSECAFEHIRDLPAVLEEMYRVLVPGGSLFTSFGPIWSSSYGHHFWTLDDNGALYNYHNVLLPPWCHLLMSREDVENTLKSQFSETAASRWADYIFASEEQNQLFFDDYERIIKASKFETILFKGYDAPYLQAKYPSAYSAEILLKLKERYPGRTGFLYDGITILLQKNFEKSLVG